MKLLLVLTGLASGLIAGMGMGGGTLLIPALSLFFGVPQHMAQGVNTLAFLPGASIALYVHKKAGRLPGKETLPLLLSGLFGAGGGAILAQYLQGGWLRKAFGIFLLLLSVYQWKHASGAS